MPSRADLEHAGFSRANPTERFAKEELAAAALPKPMAAIIQENGFLELRRDRLKGNEGFVGLAVFKLLDYKAAYGAFTNLKPSENQPVSLGDGGVKSLGLLLFWQGEYLVRLTCESANCSAAPSIYSLAEAISRSIGVHTDIPPLVQYLPAAGRKTGSERYVLGGSAWAAVFPGIRPDLIGLKDEAEVVISDYRFASESAKLVVAGFPTVALARQYYGTLPDGLQNSELGGAGFHTRRSGGLISIVIGELSVENARKLLDQIDFSYDVKWIYRKDFPRAVASSDAISLFGTVVASILLTGLFCLGSIVVGIILGGSRFLLRVLAPNNYLDKPERVQMLRLNLSKKP